MGIYREVETEVTCDTCGERIKAWCSAGTGVSRVWAAHYARAEGATVGKKGVMCKECRIAERQKKCSLIKNLENQEEKQTVLVEGSEQKTTTNQ